MTIGGVSASTSSASYLSSPAVQLAQLQGAAMTSLFSGVSGEPSDLAGLTASLVALPMYQQPGLLTGLTQWDGSMTPGSERTAAPATAPVTTPVATAPTTPAPAASPFTFNPFDQASWDVDSKGASVNVTA